MTVDYVLKRLGMFVLIIFVAGTLNFAIPRLRPTNPVEERMNQLLQQAGGVHIANVEQMIERYEERFGLKNPLWLQYVNYWIALSRLDFGQSIAYFPAEVTKEVRRAMPWTLGLVGVTTVMAAVIGFVFRCVVGMDSDSDSNIFRSAVAVDCYGSAFLPAWPFDALGLHGVLADSARRWRARSTVGSCV